MVTTSSAKRGFDFAQPDNRNLILYDAKKVHQRAFSPDRSGNPFVPGFGTKDCNVPKLRERD
ncbi:hypothetical protein BXU01_05975 [[Flexibacter] sp. ATCC 35103]|nr:hypothetical protein BXU01_05975 [[Flexibacter] sp. ATCC 35103]